MIPKFRVWDKQTKTMWNIERWHIEDEYFDLIEPNKSVVDLNAKRTWRKQRDAILMQSTGLFDKNGVEIFEGDVVSFSIDNGWDYIVSKNGLIIYSDGCYQILENGIKYRINQCLEEDIEVIGNMYELERLKK